MAAQKTLRELLEKGPVLAPCVYDCVSALTLERYGFEACCLSGGELTMSYCGVPDIGFISFGELLDRVSHIAAATSLPMIVDIDTGFGTENNVIHTCRRIAAAGAMAVHLEDQTFPKRCGHFSGKDVIPFEDYMSKVAAAVDALKGTDCLLIARTDAYNVLGKEEAIRRCNAAIDLGADLTLCEGADTREAVQEIGRRVKGKKMFGMTIKGASPKCTFDELVEWGFDLITLHFTQDAALAGIEMLAPQILEAQNDMPMTDCPGMLRDFYSPRYLCGLNEWIEQGRKYNSKIKDADWILSKD